MIAAPAAIIVALADVGLWGRRNPQMAERVDTHCWFVADPAASRRLPA